jgi:hypothetical protein
MIIVRSNSDSYMNGIENSVNKEYRSKTPNYLINSKGNNKVFINRGEDSRSLG